MSAELFRTMERNECSDLPITSNNNRVYNRHHFLRDMNDNGKRAKFEQAKLSWQAEGATLRRVYERNDWAEFVPTTFLDTILENTTYTSVAGQLADSVTIPSGLTFVYREFEHFQRAQRGGENKEFERRKGERRTQQVPLYTLGLRTYATEEEMLDIPIDSLQLELRTMGASMALERDLLWIDSLYQATSGSNASEFKNSLTAKASLNLEGLHAVLTWFAAPFAESTSTIDLTDPWASGTDTEQVEGQMRLGKFRPTDVLMNSKQYFNIVNNSFLQSQNIWTNSKILDTGELQVPLLGVNIHKVNMGRFTNVEDPDSWVPSNDIIVLDRRMGGGGTIGVRQPLQVRNWEMPQYRTQDVQIFERLGFAVQNRRALVRVSTVYGD